MLEGGPLTGSRPLLAAAQLFSGPAGSAVRRQACPAGRSCWRPLARGGSPHHPEGWWGCGLPCPDVRLRKGLHLRQSSSCSAGPHAGPWSVRRPAARVTAASWAGTAGEGSVHGGKILWPQGPKLRRHSESCWRPLAGKRQVLGPAPRAVLKEDLSAASRAIQTQRHLLGSVHR